MKYFIIFILTLLTGQAAFARTADPSMMPSSSPVIIPAQGVAPNYSGNINSSLEGGPPHRGEEGQQTSNPPGQPQAVDVQNGQGGPENPPSNLVEAPAGAVPLSGFGSKTFRVALILALAVVLGYGLWKKGVFKKS